MKFDDFLNDLLNCSVEETVEFANALSYFIKVHHKVEIPTMSLFYSLVSDPIAEKWEREAIAAKGAHK